VACRYWNWLKARNLTDNVKSGTHLDFGAGWHLTIPLLFHSFGANRQCLFGVRPLLTADLLRKTTRVFREVVQNPN